MPASMRSAENGGAGHVKAINRWASFRSGLPVDGVRASSNGMSRYRRVASWLCAALFFCTTMAFLEGREVQPGATPTAPPAAVQSWAMLFQMMDRLQNAVGRRDLTLIHIEDPVASSAVPALIGQLTDSGKATAAAQKISWINFVRDISALHTAADAAQPEACIDLFRRIQNEFQQLQSDANPVVL